MKVWADEVKDGKSGALTCVGGMKCLSRHIYFDHNHLIILLVVKRNMLFIKHFRGTGVYKSEKSFQPNHRQLKQPNKKK